MSDLDDLISGAGGGSASPPDQKPPTALESLLGGVKSVVNDVDMGASNVLQGFEQTPGYLGDVIGSAATAVVHGLRHPISNIGSPQEAQDNAGVINAIEGKGRMVAASRDIYNDLDRLVGGTPEPKTPVQQHIAAIGQGIGGALFAPAEGVTDLAKLIGSGAVAGEVSQDANTALPNHPIAANVLGLTAAALTHHVLTGHPDLVALGQQHPEYPALVNAMFENEGGGTIENPKVSPKGAEGPAQVMPGTKTGPGYGVRPSDGTEADTVREGKDYLAALLGKYGDPAKALAAYNDGPGGLEKAVKEGGQDWYSKLPEETQNYVSKGMIKLRGVSGQEPLGSVPPMAPEAIANIMNDPEAAGVLNEIGQDETPSEGTPEGLEQQVSEDMVEAPQNVTNLSDVRQALDNQKTRALLEDKLDSALSHQEDVNAGESNITPEFAASNLDMASRMNAMLGDEHPLKETTQQLEDTWRDVAQKLQDPTADKPIVDNTGYEKFTPNPQETTPANDAVKDFTEVKTDPDGTKYINYTSKAGDTIPIKLGIEPDGMAEIAVDQFGTGANKLGPAEVRSAMKTLMEMYPEIKGFGGFRRSGAGAGRVQEVYPNAGGGGKEPPNEPPIGGGTTPPEPPKGNGEDPSKYAGSINLDRMGISEAAKDSLRTMAPPVGSDIKTFPETRAAAHKLIDEKGVEGVLNMKAVAPQDLDHYALAVRQINATVQEHLVKVNEDILNPDTNSDAAKARWQYALKIAADANDRQQAISKASGRLQGSLRIKAEGGYSLLGEKVSEAMKLNLPDEEVARLIKEAPDKAAKIAKDAMTPGFADYMRSYYYNVDLLSRPTTLEHVFGGNLLINTAEDMAHMFAAFIDTPMRLLGSKDVVTFHEVYSRLLGHAVGVAKAFTKDPETGMAPFAQAWKEHRPLDWTERTGTYDLIKGPLYPLSVFGRSISAIDELSRNWTKYANIYGQASRQAFKEGFTGADFKDRFNDIANNPSASIVKQADMMAKAGRLQDTPSPIGKWLQGALHSPKPELSLPATILFPFVRMMDASMRLAVRYTPGVGMLDRYNQADFSKGLAGKSLVASRTLMGVGLMYTVVQKVLNGQVTGLGPTDPSKRKQWMATHQPESIKVGDKWFSYSWLPFAPLVSGTASATERLNGPQAKGSDYGATVTSAIMGFAHGMTGAGWAGALSDLFDVFEDNGAAGIKKIESWGGKVAAGVAIPGMVQKVDQIMDPVHRDTYQHPFVDQIKGVTPGLSQTLPAQHDVYGNVITRDGGVSQLINPFNEKTIPKGDGYKALDKLAAEVPDSVVTSDEHTIHGKKLTEAGYQKYQAYSGRLFRQMMSDNMSEFQSASNVDKVKLVKQTLREARLQARQDLWGM